MTTHEKNKRRAKIARRAPAIMARHGFGDEPRTRMRGPNANDEASEGADWNDLINTLPDPG